MNEAGRDARDIGLGPLFLKFLRFGCLAFGGPVAQIAMIRQALVEEERWVDPTRFNRLLAVMQLLPGPEAHELCVHFGVIARGRIGGLLAGLGFMLPGLLLMLGAAAAYVHFVSGVGGINGVLLGLQAAVLALIVRAVWRIGMHAASSGPLLLIAGAAAAATLAGAPFWALLVLAAVANAVRGRTAVVLSIVLIGALAVWWLATRPPAPLVTAPTITSTVSIAALFVAGLKGGLLTFGGAYTAIPYVRADTVGRGWLSDGAFLDGVALANVLPAPLVIFATFAGYLAGGMPGALAITAGMFLPAFAFSLIFFERLEAIVDNLALHRALDGVAAAVVGIIGATSIQLAGAVLTRAPADWVVVLIFALTLAAIIGFKSKLVPIAALMLSAAAGSVLLAGASG